MIELNQTAELAKAVHNRLATDAAIQAVLGDPPRLYDSSPENPVFPYLTYGDIRSEDQDGDGISAMTHTFSLHIWSRYSGRSEVLGTVNLIAEALTKAPIVMVNTTSALAIILYIDVLRAADGRTLHGLIRVKCYVQTPVSDE